MTTNVIVNAHCAETKEVRIEISSTLGEERQPTEVVTLQDGETVDHVVYDDLQITVKEVEK